MYDLASSYITSQKTGGVHRILNFTDAQDCIHAEILGGHRLRTSNEGTNQRYLKNWAYVADKICFSRT